MSIKVSLGKRIRELRDKAGLSQPDLAFEMERASTTISNYENDKREPSQSDLKLLNDVLSPYIGDHHYYLVTGRKEAQEDSLASNFIRKDLAITKFADYLTMMVELKEIRLKQKLSPMLLSRNMLKACFGEEINGELKKENGN
jgi:transcriptional regulator with XRE-family HTH domain